MNIHNLFKIYMPAPCAAAIAKLFLKHLQVRKWHCTSISIMRGTTALLHLKDESLVFLRFACNFSSLNWRAISAFSSCKWLHLSLPGQITHLLRTVFANYVVQCVCRAKTLQLHLKGGFAVKWKENSFVATLKNRKESIRSQEESHNTTTKMKWTSGSPQSQIAPTV